MPANQLHKFFLSIVIPSVLTIGLFILSIFVIILPAFERSIMTEKKQTIRELTNTAWSLLEEYHKEAETGSLLVEDAKRTAAFRIEQMRYGEENKDYFWIIDEQPRMVMHPYRSDLIGEGLTNYKDPNDKRLFVEAAKVVEQQEEGFIDYMWQWKDDSTRIVPKLSYVRGFEPWGWIVGTGIYLEDVRLEIRLLKQRLTRTSLIIALVICVILLFVIRQSLNIENKRKAAEMQLLTSRQKYKSLVEASTEGTLMTVNSRIIFSNQKFNSLSGYEANTLQNLSVEAIFELDWPSLLNAFEAHPKKSVTVETTLKCHNGKALEVIASVSKIELGGEEGFIFITKELSEKKQVEREMKAFADELQTSLLLMNQPIRHFIKPMLRCAADTSISELAKLMTRKEQQIVFLHQENKLIGVVSDSDLRKRVLAEKRDPAQPAMEIMTAPIVSVEESALFFEATLKMRQLHIAYLAVKNDQNKYIGVLSAQELTTLQQDPVSFMVREIGQANNISQITNIHRRLTVLVTGLLESGDKPQNITRIISSVSDEIAIRVVELVLEELGPAPCPFAFMIMGSEGRREQTLATDQDNALVYVDSNDGDAEAVRQYFLTLGTQICDHLHHIGYHYCPGEVMAKNPKWTQSLSVWKQYFTGWITDSDPKSVMEASIYFDFRAVYGDKQIVADLREHVKHSIENKAVFFYHMAQNILKFKPPVSLFGNIVSTEQDNGDEVKLDVKKILLPLISFIRLYALQAGISEINSLQRLIALREKGIFTQALYDEVFQSYNYLMQLRFKAQIKHLQEDQVPENTISVKHLTTIEVATLKKILSEISNLQSKVNFDFKGSS